MIILRQKRYSDHLTKVMYKFLKAKDKVETWGANIGDKAKRTFNNNRSIPKVYKPQSKVSLKRKAIEARNNIKPKNVVKLTTTKINKTKDYLSSHTPGQIVKEGMIYTGENPIAAAGTAAGYAATPVTGTYIPGTTGMAIGAEEIVRDSFPKYAERRNRYKYKKKHPIPEKVGQAVDTGINILKTVIPV